VSDIQLYDCAVKYAEWWDTKERGYVAGLAASNPQERLDALRRAGGHFRVARNFRLAYDVKIGLPRLQPALDTLDRLAPASVTESRLGKVIGELRRELGRPYGDRNLLSAATKFLWLRHKEVVVIHDRQARLALNSPYGDYDTYLSLWRSEYVRQLDKVIDACSRLAQNSEIHREIKNNVQAEWFRRRVFDIYLWRIGEAKRKG
jgi:hypothetical protein